MDEASGGEGGQVIPPPLRLPLPAVVCIEIETRSLTSIRRRYTIATMTAKHDHPPSLTRKPRRAPSYSLSHAAIERLARLAADTAERRGTKPNATATLEELILAEVRRRKMPDDMPATAKDER